MLQLKEIPLRPAEYDGAAALFSLADGVDEATVRTALEPFGTIVSCKMYDNDSAFLEVPSTPSPFPSPRASMLVVFVVFGTSGSDSLGGLGGLGGFGGFSTSCLQ